MVVAVSGWRCSPMQDTRFSLRGLNRTSFSFPSNLNVLQKRRRAYGLGPPSWLDWCACRRCQRPEKINLEKRRTLSHRQ